MNDSNGFNGALAGFNRFIVDRTGDSRVFRIWAFRQRAGETWPVVRPSFPSFDAAVRDVRRVLEAELKRHEDAAAVLKSRLKEMEAELALPESVAVLIEGCKPALLDALGAFHSEHASGRAEISGFVLEFTSTPGGDALSVTLKPHTTVALTLGPSDLASLAGLIVEAGYERPAVWQGSQPHQAFFSLVPA